jgi:hypothetical protein
MFRSLFIEDVIRFHQRGLLRSIFWLLATRREIWLAFGALAVIFILFAHSPRDRALMILLAAILACFYVTHYVVHVLTPLWFGSFTFGRLTEKYKFYARSVQYGYWFLLVPSAASLNVQSMDMPASGTIGRTYLLLRHPSDPSIVLPLIDNDARFMSHMMTFVEPERRSEILTTIDKLRPASEGALSTTDVELGS